MPNGALYVLAEFSNRWVSLLYFLNSFIKRSGSSLSESQFTSIYEWVRTYMVEGTIAATHHSIWWITLISDNCGLFWTFHAFFEPIFIIDHVLIATAMPFSVKLTNLRIWKSGISFHFGHRCNVNPNNSEFELDFCYVPKAGPIFSCACGINS